MQQSPSDNPHDQLNLEAPVKFTYYDEQDGLPTLWDEPGEGRVECVVFRDMANGVNIVSDPHLVELARMKERADG